MMPKSDRCAPEVQIFWPLMNHSSPSRSARVRNAARLRPGRRLTEQLAPDFLAAQRRANVAVELLRLGVSHHCRDAHAEADLIKAARHGEILFFLVVDHLQDWRGLPPAETLRPGQAGEARVGLFCLPRLTALQLRRASTPLCRSTGRAPALGFGVGGEEGAGLGAEGGFLGRIVEVQVTEFPSQAALRVSSRSTRRFFQNGAPPSVRASCLDRR